MSYWPHVVAALVGAGLTVQVGMNAAVRVAIGSPVLAAIVNFLVGLGAAYVAATTVLGPRLGAAALLALTLAGQMLAALAVDHYGVIGFPRSPVTPSRLLGSVLLVAGVLLIMRR